MSPSNDIVALYQSPEEWESKELLTKLLAALRKIKLLAKNRAAVLSVSFVDKDEMKKLNLEFRNKDQPTDVLSFEQPRSEDVKGAPIFLGDMVICVPIVRTQAKEHGHAPETELQILLAHGLLHLLGHDHEESIDQATAMAKLENKLLHHAFGHALTKEEHIRGLISRTTVFEGHVKRDSKPSRTPRRPGRSSR